MKKFTAAILGVSFLLLGAASASAGTINIWVSGTGSKKILLDGSSCTNCARSSAAQVEPGDTELSYATTNSGASTATYTVKYYNMYGTYFTKKGCEARITVSVNALGQITNVVTNTNSSVYAGAASCYKGTPTISLDGYTVDWNVTMGAS